MNWDWAYTFEILPQMAEASLVTLQATAFGFALAAILGLVWGIIGILEIPVLSFVVRLFIEFVRTTPLLIQLFAMYYFLPQFGIILPAMICGILTLGIHYSAYCSEVYRSGFEQVERGQWEAAKVINLTTWQTLKRVILPQAVPPIILPLGNYFVTMFKETPVLLAITVIELVATARIIGNDTFKYTEPITLAGVFFLLLSLVAAKLTRVVSEKAALPSR
ncbi:ectoine/hydroxyectoine ABC transporter permease subunit EhuD [Thalassospira sp.]|uniref:ectoine/hydroxyectoine ABC transporter permease subunit EhuD n=1 Tax=Thalassospira sp. TaxID=1912094 RepID=UPI000C63701B|nr:ectoine/hydroxyectoine ABC transporter permease subunit EhuD [Thalassospira sp.]MBC05364.1 ectoine/hydroxyectoine ABC transporter permease subunit EhuD [Thalassospira sp.]|tara:strand:+ start:5360 stop:6019 length:660 start_codon:yes stop_codon:yes gene_type:complete